MRTAADLARAAKRAGLDVVSSEMVPAPGGAPGDMTVSTRMQFDDPWAAARLLSALAEEDASDPAVRAWSLGILTAARLCNPDAMPIGDASPVVPPALTRAFNRSIVGSVQKHVKFIREPKETFQSARVTMMSGAGDCDDHARLVHALARAGGSRSRLTYFVRDGQPVHVVAQLADPDDAGTDAWQWAETTIPASYGEHPRTAFSRLLKSGALVGRRA